MIREVENLQMLLCGFQAELFLCTLGLMKYYCAAEPLSQVLGVVLDTQLFPWGAKEVIP